MTDKDDARGLLECGVMYLKHHSECSKEANGIDGDCPCGLLLHQERITAHLAAPAPEPRVAENLAMMLRRLIYQINKLDGDSSLKVLSGKASDLLSLYGLQGSPLRELPPLPKEQK